ncbi:hypothetical protein [Vasconcelosia minhoensis]|nr:hypothetical protein [Romeria gracilis]
MQLIGGAMGGAGLELSTPLTVLGGVGLALASNARRNQTLAASPTQPLTQNDSSTAPDLEIPQVPNSQAAASKSAPESAAAKSISFEIHPPERF